MKRGSKKAQFFLMAAIVMILVLYTLTINYNWAKETVDLQQLSNFEEKSESYNKESVKVINYKLYTAPPECLDPTKDDAITNKDCPGAALSQFSTDFVNYAKQSDPNYGLVFVYKMPDGSVIVRNMLGGWLNKEGPQTIKIEASKQTSLTTSEKVPIEGDVLLSWQDKSPGSIDLNIGGQQFSTSVQTDTSNFGQGLSQTVVKDADNIVIKSESFGEITIPLKDYQNKWNTIQNTYETKSGNTAVKASLITT